MTLRYSTSALIDMDVNAERIQAHSSRAALRFLNAVEATAERLLLFPEFGAKFETDDPDFDDLRVCLVSDFDKYLMFYRIKGDDVIVVRILHGHRNLPAALKETP